MTFKIVNHFLKNKMVKLIEILQDSQANTDGNIIMTLFAMQRCSLLFQFDGFGNNIYDDYKLATMSNLLNWTTLQTPLYSLNAPQFLQFITYFNLAFHWIIIILLLTQLKLKRIIKNFIVHYQLLIYIPSLKLLIEFQSEGDMVIWIISFTGMVTCYFISSLMHRNYILPQTNQYLRRFSNFSFILFIADMSLIILNFELTDFLKTLIIFIVNCFFLADSLLVKPYQYSLNYSYIGATSLMVFVSIIKIIPLKFDQESIFYLIFVFYPLIIKMMTSLYKEILFRDILSRILNLQLILTIADLLFEKHSNQILIHSILAKLENQHYLDNQDNIIENYRPIILKLFELQLQQIKRNNDSHQIETLQLYKILYIFYTCKQRSLAYIELKTFQAKSIHSSFYFEGVACVMHKKLIEETKKSSLDNQKSKLDIKRAEIIYENNIELIVSILTAKSQFWLDLNKGFKKIEQMAVNAINLSEQIWNLKDKFFKLLNFNPNQVFSEIQHLNALDLKLLSILYSLVLNDYHSTFAIEKRLEEILILEKNQQTEKINNTVLLNDSLCIIATSFAKQPGSILNKNRIQLANFFGFANTIEFQSITNIEALMPHFIQKIHNTIIARYMKKGFSNMLDQTKETFIKRKDNYIQAVNISLLQMYEIEKDYIIHGVLQKIQQKNNFILFDKNGKILGITQQIFEILGVDLRVEQFLNNGYIYYWFQNLEQNQEYAFNQDQTEIIYPKINFTKLSSEHDWAMTLSAIKSQDFDQALLSDVQKLNYWQKTTKSSSLKEHCDLIMNEFQLRKCELLDKRNPYQIKYSIQQSTIGEDLFSFFIMKIIEIEKITPSLPNTEGQSQESLTIQGFQNKSFLDQNCNELNLSEKEFSCINQPPISMQIKNIKNLLDSAEYPQNQLNFGGETFNLNTQRENNEIRLIYDDFKNSENKKRKQINHFQSNQKKQNKQSIKEIQSLKQNLLIENARLSQSTVTTNKTQIAGFQILKNLQNTTKYQTSLTNVIFNTIFLILSLTCLIILQLQLARQDMDTLKSQIHLIRIPDKFNRLYCTFTVIGQMDLEMKLLGISYGDYYEYRIQQEGNNVRPQMLSQVISIKDKFSQYDQEKKLDDAEIAIMNQYLFTIQNVSLIQFSEMANDYTQAINSIFPLNTRESLIDEQVKLLFLKGNLISLINLIGNLVDNIVSDFFLNIQSYQQIHLIFLIIQLIIISTAICLQRSSWIEPYRYQENILLLISRIPEKEAFLLIQKYKIFKDSFQNQINKWKQTNYFKEYFTYKFKKIETEQLQFIQKPKLHQRIPLNQRIQETQFSIWHTQMMLFFFWMLLIIFVQTSYVFGNLNIQNSYPELNLCMQFVRFKQEFDSCMIISQFIKNQPLLSAYQKESGIYDKNPEYSKSDGFFKTYTQDLITQFSLSLDAGKGLYGGIYDNIVASQKISETNKNLLLGLYQDDLCNYIEDEMPFCNYQEGIFKYFPNFPQSDEKNNNRERLRQGFNGIYQQILSLFSSKYSSELNGIEVTKEDEIMQFLETPEYVQLLLPYFFDLDKAIVKFYVTIINASVDILESDYQLFQIYYICFGIFAQFIFLTIVIIQVRKIQRQVRGVRQALVLLPHESLLDIQIYNAIKRIEKQI